MVKALVTVFPHSTWQLPAICWCRLHTHSVSRLVLFFRGLSSPMLLGYIRSSLPPSWFHSLCLFSLLSSLLPPSLPLSPSLLSPLILPPIPSSFLSPFFLLSLLPLSLSLFSPLCKTTMQKQYPYWENLEAPQRNTTAHLNEVAFYQLGLVLAVLVFVCIGKGSSTLRPLFIREELIMGQRIVMAGKVR